MTKSLQNSGLPSFDLMQFHTWDDLWLQDDRWVHKMMDLKSQGLFHAVGISLNRWEPWNGIAAVKSGLIDSVQVIYNIFDQNPEDELFPACRQHDVALIARVPFDEGTLTGNLTKSSTWPKEDWRSTYFVPENLNASRNDHGRDGTPVVSLRSDCGNGHPRNAIHQKCRGQHGRQRCGPFAP